MLLFLNGALGHHPKANELDHQTSMRSVGTATALLESGRVQEAEKLA